MKIFISHASEERALAEELELALRGEGHAPWLGAVELEPTKTFHETIRDRIRHCELFLFLVSPSAVAAGRYSLAEMEMARQRWPHPAGRVLAVVARPLDKALVPPYLRAATILDSQGNLTAAVLNQVALLNRQRQRRWIRWVAGVAVALAVGLAVVAMVSRGRASELTVEIDRVVRWKAGLPWEGDRYNAVVRIANGLDLAVELSSLEAESESAAVKPIVTHEVSGQGWLSVDAHADRAWSFVVRWQDRTDGTDLSEAKLPAHLRWRVCWTALEARRCTALAAWSPSGDFEREAVRPLSAELRARARSVVVTGDQFLVALGDPSAVVRLDGPEPAGTPEPVEGEARALLVSGDRLFVATAAPDQVVELHPHNLQDLNVWPIRVADETLSTTPLSLAMVDGTLWLSTDPRARSRALLVHEHDEWRTLPYQDQVDEVLLMADATGLVGRTESTPHYLFRFDRQRQQTLSGHDLEDVGCMSALTIDGDTLVALACRFEVARFTTTPSGIAVKRRVPGPDRDPYDWEGDAVAVVGDSLYVALSRWEREPRYRPVEAEVHRWRAGTWTRLIHVPGKRVVSMAASPRGALVVLADPQGGHDAWFLAP